MRAGLFVPLASALLLGCAPAERAPGAADSARGGDSVLVMVPDTLVAATASAELWLTLPRDAVDSAGRPCRERALEIRREGRRLPVPLLYTAERPRIVDDSTAEVHLWTHCRPGPLYRVDLATGRPTPVRSTPPSGETRP